MLSLLLDIPYDKVSDYLKIKFQYELLINKINFLSMTRENVDICVVINCVTSYTVKSSTKKNNH